MLCFVVLWLRLMLRLSVGIVKLCWNNFRNNRYQKEFENYARIIGSFQVQSS